MTTPRAHPITRRFAVLASLFVLLAGGCTTRGIGVSAPAVTAYENAWWFTGTAFEWGTMYVSDGHFVLRSSRPSRPSRIDAVVDLAGGYVVPPFAEAHN